MSSNSLLLGFDKHKECASNCHTSNNCYTCQLHEIQGVPKKRTLRQPLLPTFQLLEYLWREGTSNDTLARLECCQRVVVWKCVSFGTPWIFHICCTVRQYLSIVKDTQISLISPERPIGNMFMSDFSLLLSLFFISGKSYFPICHFLPAPN